MKLKELTSNALHDSSFVPDELVGQHVSIPDRTSSLNVYRVNEDKSLTEVLPKNKKRRVKKRVDFQHRDKRALLKIKIKSLDAEMRIIRLEEQKTPSLSRYIELRAHRKALGQKSRAAQLALAFIRGRRIEQVESLPAPTTINSFERPADVARLLADVRKNIMTFADNPESVSTDDDHERWLREASDFLIHAKVYSGREGGISSISDDDALHDLRLATA